THAGGKYCVVPAEPVTRGPLAHRGGGRVGCCATGDGSGASEAGGGALSRQVLGTCVSRRRLLLAGLWLTAAAAEWAALRPVIFQEHVRPEVVLYHVVGGSFAACGLRAMARA